jgi:hypothetical protein
MAILAWLGAIEAAIPILYLAFIGQRSIEQWRDDRRRQRPAVEATDLRPEANPQPRPRPHLLSVQSLGDYVEYVWRDP